MLTEARPCLLAIRTNWHQPSCTSLELFMALTSSSRLSGCTSLRSATLTPAVNVARAQDGASVDRCHSAYMQLLSNHPLSSNISEHCVAGPSLATVAPFLRHRARASVTIPMAARAATTAGTSKPSVSGSGVGVDGFFFRPKASTLAIAHTRRDETSDMRPARRTLWAS